MDLKLTALAYSIAEACALSSVGRTTLYAAIARGDLKTKKVGRRTLITMQDLKSWLDSCPAKPFNQLDTEGHAND